MIHLSTQSDHSKEIKPRKKLTPLETKVQKMGQGMRKLIEENVNMEQRIRILEDKMRELESYSHGHFNKNL